MSASSRDVSNRRVGPLLVLFGANAVSLTGNVMTLTAVPWFVLQTTGSAAMTGIIASLNFLPIVLANLFGGAFVDRLGHKRASVIADLTSGFTVALIPLLYLTVGLPFWVLGTFVFLGALLDSPGSTARAALLPEAAQQAGWSLERASGVYAAVERGSRLAGAPLAGFLIAFIGATNVLWVDAATFFLSAAAISLAALAAPRPEPSSRYLTELKEGLTLWRRDRVLVALTLTVTATNLLDSFSTVLLPVLAKELYGSPVSLGLMLGALGGGSVASALMFAASGHRLPRHRSFAICFSLVALYYPLLALFPPEIGAILVMFGAGLASGPLNPILHTVEFERVPPHMRGRVLGLTMALAWMAMPFGVLVAGVLVETVGLRATLLGAGIAYVLIAASIWINRAMKEMDTTASKATAKLGRRAPSASV
jgi:MFS family permease